MTAEVAASLGPDTVGPSANVPGVHTPATLTTHTGNWTSSFDGEVVQNLNITGALIFNHVGVVARNCRARRATGASATNRSATLRAEWCSFGVAAGIPLSESYNGIGVRNWDLYRCEVFGAVDLLKLTGGFARVRESWVHDMAQWLVDPQQSNGPSHADLFQTTLGADVSELLIEDCRLDGWVFRPEEGGTAGSTAGDTSLSYAATGLISVFRQTTDYTVSNISIKRNRLDGNAYRWIYALHDSGDPATQATITDNLLIKRFSTFGREALLSVTTLSGITWGRNVDQGGATVNAPGTTAAPDLPPEEPPPPPPPPPAPTLSTMAPASGPANAAQSVTLTGTALAGTTAVNFAGSAITPTTVADTSVTFTAPARAAGNYAVTVTTPSGTSNALTYTATVPAPVLTAISPNQGPEAGGTGFAVVGTNLDGATTVTFGTTPVTPSSVTSTTVSGTAPPAEAGTVDVTVTTPAGRSNALQWTYVAPEPPPVQRFSVPAQPVVAPILAYPFRVLPGGVIAPVAQDSDEAHAQQIAVLVATRLGERVLVPRYGITDPAFVGLDPSEVTAGVELYGPPVTITAVRGGTPRSDRLDITIEFDVPTRDPE